MSEDIKGFATVTADAALGVWSGVTNGISVLAEEIEGRPRVTFDFLFLIVFPYVGSIMKIRVNEYLRTERGIEGSKKV